MYLQVNKQRINIENKDAEFDKVIKFNDKIHCCYNSSVVLKISGISDFSIFEVEGGEFSSPQKTKEELQTEINAKLLKDSANLQIELDKQKELNATLLMQIAKLGGR